MEVILPRADTEKFLCAIAQYCQGDECRYRPWFGPWPGRGPFSHLPPWQRPGWYLGRGWCWRYLYAYWRYPTTPVDPRSELEALEAYRSDLEEELKGVDARIRDLKELLSKESEKP